MATAHHDHNTIPTEEKFVMKCPFDWVAFSINKSLEPYNITHFSLNSRNNSDILKIDEQTDKMMDKRKVRVRFTREMCHHSFKPVNPGGGHSNHKTIPIKWLYYIHLYYIQSIKPFLRQSSALICQYRWAYTMARLELRYSRSLYRG